MNRFNEDFENLCESHERSKQIRTRTNEAIVELEGLMKKFNSQQKDMIMLEDSVNRLMAGSLELKRTLIDKVIKKEEVLMQKADLQSSVDRLNEQVENLERETNSILCDEDLENLCQRYSKYNQLSILNKIQDARCKLLEYGLSPFQVECLSHNQQ